MTNVRTRVAAVATIIGLGGLGGFAMATNPARDSNGAAHVQVASTRAGSGPATQPVATHTSGATATKAPATSLVTRPAKPVVTRSSGGTAGPRGHEIERDDVPAPELHESSS
jgi:hypothetical protein